MGRIIIIQNSDFSRNRIVKVDITKQVEKTVDVPKSYSSSTVSVINSSLKIMNNINGYSK